MPRQLKMIWSNSLDLKPEKVPTGYSLRSFRKGDEKMYASILAKSELGTWDVQRIKEEISSNSLAPEGVFFIMKGDKLVATAAAYDRMQQKSADEKSSKVGELGLLAVLPEERGKGLGKTVCATAVQFMLEKGYESIYLLTDHWRLPAIKTFLHLGFEPEITTSDARYFWNKLSVVLDWPLKEPKRAKVVRGPTGEEIAWKTLAMERVSEPCILTSWCMKRDFFRYLTHVDNIYEDAVDTVVQAFIRAGANLCPQLAMPSSGQFEHIGADPFYGGQEFYTEGCVERELCPEDVLRDIDSLPDPDTLEKTFNFEKYGEAYAKRLKALRDMAHGEILFIETFGQADFMGGYNKWGYENYLMALALYPQDMEKYYRYTGEWGRLYNMALVHSIEKYGLAPFVYGGQDICFNDGPICSTELLREIYFPHLKRAVEPLHEAGVKIIWHCDGDVRPILEDLVYTVGVSGFQGFQEETGCTLESIASLKMRDGSKPLIWGSISVTTTLPHGTVEDVKRDVERCFNITKGRGFALASTSSILPETPLENILAMYDHALEYGRKVCSQE